MILVFGHCYSAETVILFVRGIGAGVREFIKKYGISMGLVCLIPIILLLPNLPYFNTHLIGALGSDAPKHVWGQWWIHRSLMLHGEIPFELDINNYPDGGRFFCLDTANGIFSVPLRVLFHPVLTFNLLILAHLMAAGLSAWYLCLQLVKDHRAAMVAGAAFSCAPFVMSHGLASGVSEGIFLFPLPLIILCMFRMATRTSCCLLYTSPSPRD